MSGINYSNRTRRVPPRHSLGPRFVLWMLSLSMRLGDWWRRLREPSVPRQAQDRHAAALRGVRVIHRYPAARPEDIRL